MTQSFQDDAVQPRSTADNIRTMPEIFVVAIRPAYIPKLKQIAELTGASLETFVNQCVSDALESA